jgi:hypothetical protein
MIINCHGLTLFLDTIAGLVERGITFEAYSDSFMIRLTGGF